MSWNGPEYDTRFRALAESGMDVHGEAVLVASLVPPGSRILDAGCGTGRVAIELARRGYGVTGVDVEPSMLAVAREAAPDLDWRLGDLATLDLGEAYDLAVLAGNVMVFVEPGTEGAVLRNVAAHAPLVVAGFQLKLPLDRFDALATEAGLALRDRWATWDRDPYDGGDYAVSVMIRG